MKKNSKRYREILKNSVKNKKVDAKEALELVKKNSTSKFDESIDLNFRINNLIDETYEQVSGYPGLPRQVFIGLDYQF